MFPTAVLPCNNLVPSSAIASIKTMLETDVRWPKHFVNLESRRRHEQTNQTGMLNASKHCMQELIETIHVYVICIYFIIYICIFHDTYTYIYFIIYIYKNKSIYTYIITIIAIVDHIFLQMFRMFQLKTTKTLQRYNMMCKKNNIHTRYIYTNHVLSDCRMLTNCDFISSHSLRLIVLCIFRGFLASHLGLFRSHDPYITAT